MLRGIAAAAALVVALQAGPAHAQLIGGTPPDWNGGYVGVHGGWGWGWSKHVDFTGFDTGLYSAKGGFGGLTAGWAWQFGQVVLGVEGDVSRGNLSGEVVDGCGGTIGHCGTKLDTFGTARVRAGYAIGSVLPYVTGGLVVGDLYGNEGDVPANTANGSGSRVHPGWAAGGGVELRPLPQWSVKAEYLHVDLGQLDTFVGYDILGAGVPTNQQVSFCADLFRLGINYHF